MRLAFEVATKFNEQTKLKEKTVATSRNIFECKKMSGGSID